MMTIRHWGTTQLGSDETEKKLDRAEDHPESQTDINTLFQRP